MEEGLQRLAADQRRQALQRLQRADHDLEPGPDGSLATTGDNTQITVFNLDRTNRLPTTIVQNIDGYEGTYKTLEFSANKRYSNRWSMVASYSYVWTHEFNNQYFNNRFGIVVSQQSLSVRTV